MSDSGSSDSDKAEGDSSARSDSDSQSEGSDSTPRPTSRQLSPLELQIQVNIARRKAFEASIGIRDAAKAFREGLQKRAPRKRREEGTTPVTRKQPVRGINLNLRSASHAAVDSSESAPASASASAAAYGLGEFASEGQEFVLARSVRVHSKQLLRLAQEQTAAWSRDTAFVLAHQCAANREPASATWSFHNGQSKYLEAVVLQNMLFVVFESGRLSVLRKADELVWTYSGSSKPGTARAHLMGDLCNVLGEWESRNAESIASSGVALEMHAVLLEKGDKHSVAPLLYRGSARVLHWACSAEHGVAVTLAIA